MWKVVLHFYMQALGHTIKIGYEIEFFLYGIDLSEVLIYRKNCLNYNFYVITFLKVVINERVNHNEYFYDKSNLV